MNLRPILLGLTINLALVACQHHPSKSEQSVEVSPTAEASHPQPVEPAVVDADRFIAGVNQELRHYYKEVTAAQWIAQTFITPETELLVSKADEANLARLSSNVEKSKAFSTIKGISPETQRAIDLLKLSTAMPAPKDPEKLAELTTISSRLGAIYGSGKYCKNPQDEKSCKNLTQLSDVLAQSRDWNTTLEAWTGWHSISRTMRKDYRRFTELLNEGAKETGYANAGEMWRAGYDMSPAQFQQETDRLWNQVQPLYEQLQCYTRTKLKTKYGNKMPQDGTIPAHITGNMWAQDWSNLYPLLQPYPGVSNLDVTQALKKQGYTPVKINQRAEDFYTSIGFPPLPKSYYTNSQFIRPRDREVVCHASAWDIDLKGDVRIKMCIDINEEDYRTVYHEMGHIYYYLAYNPLEPLFQTGANDGFHEAIGDTIQLSLTPTYLHTVGLASTGKQSHESIINAQMKMALEKIAFLPFGKLIDEWRWGVFDGSIKPEEYNAAWWKLKQKYQGISSPVARNEEDFDPGAKYHVPNNTPYMRYFLAHILQFQFQRALCQASGHQGPLNECSIYGNKEAGAKYWAMMQKGASQPWQTTLKEMTGSDQMDATAILDYFAPLQTWLKDQNKNQQCGWQ